MKKKLTYSTLIDAPRRIVWETMLDPEDYKVWTAVFFEGSYFSGSWEQGTKMQFLTPAGDGMTALIEEIRPYEYVSIKHIGEIKDFIEDTTNERVMSWAPAFENYSFADSGSGTELQVSMDTLLEYEEYMNETYPKALAVLKELCERKG
jgi:uncharacterized protein YndB with AHSA1/START domain